MDLYPATEEEQGHEDRNEEDVMEFIIGTSLVVAINVDGAARIGTRMGSMSPNAITSTTHSGGKHRRDPLLKYRWTLRR